MDHVQCDPSQICPACHQQLSSRGQPTDTCTGSAQTSSIHKCLYLYFVPNTFPPAPSQLWKRRIRSLITGANTARDSVIFTRPRSWKRDKWASNIVKEQTVPALASARRLWVAEGIRSTLEVTQVWSSTPTAAALKVQGQTSI